MVSAVFVASVLVALILLWAAVKLMEAWEVPGQLQTSIYVILVVIIAFWIINYLFPGATHLVRFR